MKAGHYLDWNGDPRYGWSLRCAHDPDEFVSTDETGTLHPEEGCWVLSWWEAEGMELITDDPLAKWPGYWPIPLDVEGDGWHDGPLLIPAGES